LNRKEILAGLGLLADEMDKIVPRIFAPFGILLPPGNGTSCIQLHRQDGARGSIAGIGARIAIAGRAEQVCVGFAVCCKAAEASDQECCHGQKLPDNAEEMVWWELPALRPFIGI
jgi:hypothetical protein